MTVSRPWRSLNVTGDYPLLFLKAQIDDAKCEIQLTDLNRLWAASWSRSELLQSAKRQNTSIDPSEDDAQYDQFVSKVDSALEGHRETAVNLQPRPTKDGLDLTVSAILPGSLPTFKWTIPLFRLDGDDGSAFEAEILTPLLVLANSLRSRIKYLVDELGHKDRVIAKVADKLENVGQDLTQVFPGASKSGWNKKLSRAQLAKHVDGLAPFDITAWQVGTTKAIDEEDPSIDAINELLTEMPKAGLLSAHKDTIGVWWLPRGDDILSPDQTSYTSAIQGSPRTGPYGRATGSTTSRPTLAEQESSMNGAGFQRQTTPPVGMMDANDEETEDDDDLDISTQHRSQPKGQAEQSAASSAQGVPNKSNLDSTRERSLSRFPTDSKTAKEGIKSSDTSAATSRKGDSRLGAFEGALEGDTPTPEPESEAVVPTSTSPAGSRRGGRKLGGFGGITKRKTADPETDAISPISPDATSKRSGRLGAFGGAATHSVRAEAASDRSPAQSKTRLDAFGGISQVGTPAPETDSLDDSAQNASKAHHVDQAVAEERSARAPHKNEEVERQRQRSEERANKRRDKLKAEIAERSKEPVKKKRRF